MPASPVSVPMFFMVTLRSSLLGSLPTDVFITFFLGFQCNFVLFFLQTCHLTQHGLRSISDSDWSVLEGTACEVVICACLFVFLGLPDPLYPCVQDLSGE